MTGILLAEPLPALNLAVTGYQLRYRHLLRVLHAWLHYFNAPYLPLHDDPHRLMHRVVHGAWHGVSHRRCGWQYEEACAKPQRDEHVCNADVRTPAVSCPAASGTSGTCRPRGIERASRAMVTWWLVPVPVLHSKIMNKISGMHVHSRFFPGPRAGKWGRFSLVVNYHGRELPPGPTEGLDSTPIQPSKLNCRHIADWTLNQLGMGAWQGR
ncbi:hypothetical protein BJY52DRAFT_1314853 [Lactarius psammicola]|nr:hypothetical protein BJY52DRAFT_1314853 [Lactarius psammicola]